MENGKWQRYKMYKTNMFNFYKFHKYYSSSEQIKNLSKFKKRKIFVSTSFYKNSNYPFYKYESYNSRYLWSLWRGIEKLSEPLLKSKEGVEDCLQGAYISLRLGSLVHSM